MPVLNICKRHLPNSITKNIYTVTSFSNNTASNLTDKLAIDTKLSLVNRISLKFYI